MITEIEARYRVVTPLFCAGADPQRAELRAPSFKGVLRFWWRALAWPRLNGDLDCIQNEEEALFGNADRGQSRVSIRLDPPPRQLYDLGKNLSVPQGARYLGYGILERDADRIRGYLRAPVAFDVHLRVRGLSSDQRGSLIHVLVALGTLGGMGSRSRRGFGSLVLASLKVDRQHRWKPPASIRALGDTIRRFHSDQSPNRLPQYTAISAGARYLLLSSGRGRPLDLLGDIGTEYKAAIRSTDRSKRTVFGLPRGRHVDRRASPLFIHVHECRDTPVAVLSFLPARFLPEGRSDISIGESEVSQSPEAELYRPVHEFLDRLLNANNQQRRDTFTDVQEIVP